MSLAESTPAPKPLSADDIRACIRGHFGANGEKYAVLFEVRNGTGWRANRSVDAVVMGLWPSLGMELWGMEIKCSRWDWMREVKDPGKASEVFNYFDRWFLIAPADVAKLDELPQPWGWLQPDNGKLVRVREAARNENVKAVDRHFLGALLRQTARKDDAFVAAAVERALKEQHQQFEDEIEKRALEKVGDLRAEAEGWIKLRDLLKQKGHDYVHADEVVDCLSALLKSGVSKSWGGLRSLNAEVDRIKASLAKISEQLSVPLVEPKNKRRRSR